MELDFLPLQGDVGQRRHRAENRSPESSFPLGKELMQDPYIGQQPWLDPLNACSSAAARGRVMDS